MFPNGRLGSLRRLLHVALSALVTAAVHAVREDRNRRCRHRIEANRIAVLLCMISIKRKKRLDRNAGSASFIRYPIQLISQYGGRYSDRCIPNVFTVKGERSSLVKTNSHHKHLFCLVDPLARISTPALLLSSRRRETGVSLSLLIAVLDTEDDRRRCRRFNMKLNMQRGMCDLF